MKRANPMMARKLRESGPVFNVIARLWK